MATNAHTEHPGGGKPPFPPFNKETFASQLVWFVIFFVALYVLIGRFAIPRIGGIIEARRGRVEGDLAEANRLKEQSDAALKAYEKSLADARNRAQTLANETRDKLNAEAEEARKKLESRAQRRSSPRPRRPSRRPRPPPWPTCAASRSIPRRPSSQRLIGTAPSGSAVEAAVADALKR